MTGAFFASSGDNIWAPLDFAGIAAALYLIALAGFTTRAPFPRLTRLAVWFCLLLTGTGVFFCWRAAERRSEGQRDRLVEVHSAVSRSMMVDEMPSILLRVMKAYYTEPIERRRSLGATFRDMYPSAQPGVNMHAPYTTVDSLIVCVSALSDTGVVLVGQEAYVRGRNPAFRNYTGRVGMVQAKALLTSEGVRYESEN